MAAGTVVSTEAIRLSLAQHMYGFDTCNDHPGNPFDGPIVLPNDVAKVLLFTCQGINTSAGLSLSLADVLAPLFQLLQKNYLMGIHAKYRQNSNGQTIVLRRILASQCSEWQ